MTKRRKTVSISFTNRIGCIIIKSMRFFRRKSIEPQQKQEKQEELIQEEGLFDQEQEQKPVKRQKLDKTAMYVGGGLLAILFLFFLFRPQEKVVVQGDIAAQKKILEEALKSQEQLNQRLIGEISALSQKIEQLEKEKQVEKEKQAISSPPSSPSSPPPSPPPSIEIIPPSPSTASPPPPPPVFESETKEPYKPKLNRMEREIKQESKNTTNTTPSFVFASAEEKKEEKVAEKKKVYLPAGSTLRGVIVNSFPAPVDGAFPAVLIELYGHVRLPNNYRISLDRCLVIAKGQGTYVLERAKLETYKLSCMMRDGKVIESDIRGMVVSGEDGIEGVAGKFINVNREQFLTGLGGGTISGFFSALQRGQLLQRDTAFGTTTTIKDELLYALYGSLASTWNEFAKWYLDQAKKILPVVVVSAGKPVYITLVDGVSLDVEVDSFRGNL